MAKPVTAKSIKSKVVKQMKDLGTYRKEFEMIIDIFAGMLYQYQKPTSIRLVQRMSAKFQS